MLYDENRILNLIKLGPLSVILFSFIITYIVIQNNNMYFENEMEEIRRESVNQKKELIKIQVEQVYDFINSEKNQTTEKLKINIKKRVNEAHSIINSIYKKNQDKNKLEIQKIVKDVLRDMRFNNNRGYFFIYDMSGLNILHPLLPHLEGKNMFNFHDIKGKYIIQESTSIVKTNGEGFLSWWFKKPDDKHTEYEKIGFVKHFEPYNWFIGTGEYVLDFEKDLKNDILRKIDKIKYGKNGYIFVVDKEGVYLSHVRKSNINKNRINLIDANGFMITKEIINTGKKGEGYISYIGTIKPSTGKPAEKTSYVKGFKDWEWAIGSGAYTSDIEEIINKKRKYLQAKNKENIVEIIVISVSIFILLFICSVFFANIIKNRFQVYKESVKEKNSQLEDLNIHLEQKVIERTKNLNYINKKLKSTVKNLSATQKDLLLAEKMATLGELVGAITHEINSPLGVGITTTSHLSYITEEFDKLYKKEGVSEEEFETYIANIKEISRILDINLNNTAKLVKSFKNVAVDQSIEEKRKFNIKLYIDEILLALKSKTKSTHINIIVECEENIILDSYPGLISQILTNLINNSILHGYEQGEEGEIKIIINDLGNDIEIIYKDNGKGISKSLAHKIFDQYFTTKRGEGGTGLGLFIIKEIVTKKLKGSITINIPEEKGLEFLLVIPKE